VVSQCLEALKWRGVVLFRGLNLEDEAQVAFSRKLGELVSPGGREIFKVSLDPTVNPAAEYLKGTFHWHMDGATDPVPQKAATRFRYAHEWQQGDLVVWDNTGMLHRALPYDVSSQRTLHRTTVHGEEAFA